MRRNTVFTSTPWNVIAASSRRIRSSSLSTDWSGAGGSAIGAPDPGPHALLPPPAMIDLLKAAVLGVVEGLTEFVPVSSTGHLIVASRLLDFGDPTFEIFIQLGAILALTWEYRATLLELAAGAVRPGPMQRFVLYVLIAFLPAAIVGLLTHYLI